MTTNNKDERLGRDIERAIKARGLMESMKAWDESMNQQTVRPLWMRMVRSIGYAVAAAAMVVGVLFVPFSTESTMNHRKMAQTTGKAMHDLYLTAGGGSADLVYQATEKMCAGEYKNAYSLLCEAELALDEEFSDHTNVQYLETKKDIRQLKGLCDLSRGQLFYTIRGKLNLR